MSRLFISHSSKDNFAAVALRNWLKAEGWDDVFLDVDPERGIAASERWERKLHEAADRCEAVIFLVSSDWLQSGWCMKEYVLARGLNKKLFAVIIDPAKTVEDLPPQLSGTWQVIDLAHRQDMQIFRVPDPDSHEERHILFSREGLQRLKVGLVKAALDPSFFAWPPPGDPDRAPYRGLQPLEAADAGIFFGRDAPIVEFKNALRGLRDAAAPRLVVILGASGAGKSSFLRAGLWPRLVRDDRHFLPLRPIRPERAALFGENGLLPALEAAFPDRTRAELRSRINEGAAKVRPLLGELADRAFRQTLPEDDSTKPPTIVIAIDQAEELFRAEGAEEAAALLRFVRELAAIDDPAVMVIFAVRSDSYDTLQNAEPVKGLLQKPLSLPPMPRHAYREVIEGPARRAVEAGGNLAIAPQLTECLLEDIEKGGGKDALPLLAFTLEQLYLEYRAAGRLEVEHYRGIGGLKGAIDAAVGRAFARADRDRRIPADRAAREVLLRRGLIPWLAGVDPDSKTPRRNIARRSDVPAEAMPLMDLLVEERLLSTDVIRERDASGTEVGIATIEPAHEALLRQWGLLDGWLAEDFGLLATLEGVKRAARDWDANARAAAWLAHHGQRLAEARKLDARSDIAARLDVVDRSYLTACADEEEAERQEKLSAQRWRRRMQALVYVLLIGVIAGLVAFINQSYIRAQWRWAFVQRPFMIANFRPYVREGAAEAALLPKNSFRECAAGGKDYCPEMVVVPAGSFMMGSPPTEKGRESNEGPQHPVTIARPFAVSKFEITFDEWDTCMVYGDCPDGISDSDYGRGNRPVINVTWDQAQRYVAWLAAMTGKPYRLLTEAEFEYAARGGMQTIYPWGDELGTGNANCSGCGSQWDKIQTAPVGSFPANGFGLYDMVGNVWQWVADCYHATYDDAPHDGSEWTASCPPDRRRVGRASGWDDSPDYLRSAHRGWDSPAIQFSDLGFRVGRTLDPQIVQPGTAAK